MVYEPNVTLLVAAYNEADCLTSKVYNSLALEYPREKLDIVFVTDGSTDGSEALLGQYENITVLHTPQRRGKLAAVDRAMHTIKTPIVIFSDANTRLNRDAVRLMVRHFEDPSVGAVAGEKRVFTGNAGETPGLGEGLYWKYESFLKKLDSELFSVVGAAGELFAVRQHLYEYLPPDTIIEDFVLTLRVAERGYRVVYEPRAYAMESASASLTEEMKRKVRIAAGGFQAIRRLKGLLNPLRHGILSFQYVSHRLLRWAVTPFLLPLAFAASGMLAWSHGGTYGLLFSLQALFYVLALAGYTVQSITKPPKLLLVPLYFVLMNVAVYRGLFRYLRGNQSVLWEKARRSNVSLEKGLA